MMLKYPRNSHLEENIMEGSLFDKCLESWLETLGTWMLPGAMML